MIHCVVPNLEAHFPCLLLDLKLVLSNIMSRMMYNDLVMAGDSGYGHSGGCYCDKKGGDGGFGDLGLLAAGFVLKKPAVS